MLRESIVSAAIRERATGLVFSLPKPKRHHHILHAAAALHRELKYMDQGFITSEGRFVARLEAAKLAELAGQLKNGLNSPPNLFSEDLW
jgi:hypothetical protein